MTKKFLSGVATGAIGVASLFVGRVFIESLLQAMFGIGLAAVLALFGFAGQPPAPPQSTTVRCEMQANTVSSIADAYNRGIADGRKQHAAAPDPAKKQPPRYRQKEEMPQGSAPMRYRPAIGWDGEARPIFQGD
jgi:hypothetical protein